MTIPSMFHMDANRTTSPAHWAFFTIINCPPASMSVESASSEAAIKPSRSICPAYFG